MNLKELKPSKSLYDYVANNYWSMTKSELRDLFLELNYATYKNVDSTTMSTIENETINSLIERSEEE